MRAGWLDPVTVSMSLRSEDPESVARVSTDPLAMNPAAMSPRTMGLGAWRAGGLHRY